MHTSPTLANVAAALAAANAEIRNPNKNKEVTVFSRKTNSSYRFEYATLDHILDCIRPILAKNALSIVQSIITGEKDIAVQTTILHASGEFISTKVPFTTDSTDNQSLGSGITYARRYGITCLICLAADEDDDGNASCGNEAQTKPQPAFSATTVVVPQPSVTVKSAAVSSERIEYDKLVASICKKLGDEEGTHQIAAIKKANGTNWKKTVAELKTLEASL